MAAERGLWVCFKAQKRQGDRTADISRKLIHILEGERGTCMIKEPTSPVPTENDGACVFRMQRREVRKGSIVEIPPINTAQLEALSVSNSALAQPEPE